MAAGRGEAVVAISSIEARQPAPGHGPHGIRINAVAPGLIEREGLAEAWPEGVAQWLVAVPLGRLGTVDDVANAVLFLVSDLSGWITGANLLVEGGVLARPTW